MVDHRGESPSITQQAVARYLRKLQAELQALDGPFQAALLGADSSEIPKLAEAYSLTRFDRIAEWLLPTFIERGDEEWLKTTQEKNLEELGKMLQKRGDVVREKILSRVSRRLGVKRLEWSTRARSTLPHARHRRASPIDSPHGWGAIEIRVLSDHRVQIFFEGKALESYNFAELGFGDARNGLPIAAWSTLLSFAKTRRIPAKSGSRLTEQDAKRRRQLEKHIQTIRQKLRAVVVNADGDPLPLVAECYEPAFKITDAPAANV